MKNIRPQNITRKITTAVVVTPVTKLSSTRACTKKKGKEVFQFTRSSGARSMPWSFIGPRCRRRDGDGSPAYLPVGRLGRPPGCCIGHVGARSVVVRHRRAG